MDTLSFQQFKFVGLAIHQMQNSKKPKELCLQLLIAFGFDIFAVQPNFFARSVTFRLSSFIVGLFLQFLSMLQVFSVCSHKISKFLSQLISCFELGVRVNIFFIGNARVLPIVELKRRILYAGVFCIIISKFHYE